MTNLISAFLIAKDEEDRVQAAIESAKMVADEIILIDSGSSDRTCEIARELGAKVIFNAWKGYGLQKRFGEDQCQHAWLLNLDADERLSPELVSEIRTLELGKNADGYRLLIRDRFPFEAKPKSWAYTYDPVRLYNRRSGRYSDHYVHDRVTMKPGAKVTGLKGLVYHDSMLSISQTIAKTNRYSSFQAETMHNEGRRLNRFRLIFEFPIAFFKSFFVRRYYRYGRWGLVLAINYAYGRFTRLAKCYEIELIEANRAP